MRRRGAGVSLALAVLLGSTVAAFMAPGTGAAATRGWFGSPGEASAPISLDRGWFIQSSADVGVGVGGSVLSRPGFSTEGWFPVTVPSTVLAGLVANGVYPDPYVGTSLSRIPEARFEVPWWYRVQFDLPGVPGGRTWLHFDGINYRADVWLNGRRIASSTQVAGTFRTYAFDVTDAVRPGANALAVEVYPVDPNGDLTLTWIDWSPMPPDHGMGIWHDVWLSRTGPVSIADAHVVSRVTLAGTNTADVTVAATMRNDGPSPLTTDVAGVVQGLASFSRAIELAPGQSKVVTFDAGTDPQLHLIDPPIWWPYQMGGQPLEQLTISASVGSSESDRKTITFGIRQVTSTLTRQGHRLFLVNGAPILVRGGGWASDMLLRPVPGRVDDQLSYVRDLGLNAVRLEGKLESDHFFDEADRLGILVLPGWMCCDRWQQSWKWTPDEVAIAAASMRSQADRLRNHPSVIGFLIGSDTKPAPDVQRMYVRTLREADWPNPILASASDDSSSVLGPTGVKMTGPYDWVPPIYWFDPRADGGAAGFNSETSAGASIPEIEDLRRMLTAGERRALWTEPRTPQYHAGVGDSVFKTFHIFDRAITARMGGPRSLADYVEKAQVMQYENERAMFEAFSRNKYRSTGLIQWMLNNAWPSLHWNLFDWFLEPNGSYFGAKEANRPLHALFGYDDRRLAVVNQTPSTESGLVLDADIFDLDGSRVWSKSASVSVGADATDRAFRIPTPKGLSSSYFVELRLFEPNGGLVDRNVYWLSTADETLAWDRSHWFVTPTKTYADFRALSRLPDVRPSARSCSPSPGMVNATIVNDSSSVAFFVRLRLLGSDGADVTPVSWSDGDVTLMPGESVTVTATFDPSDVGGAPSIEMSGWNVPASAVSAAAC